MRNCTGCGEPIHPTKQVNVSKTNTAITFQAGTLLKSKVNK